MDDPKADIVMYFLDENGKRINAESSLSVDKKDDFMAGFHAASNATQYSNFFEVADFNFALKLNASEQGGGNITSKTQAQPKIPPKVAAGSHGGVQKAADEYERWRSADEEQLKKIKYPIEFGTFSFKRTIDAASPLFFMNCANQVTFKEAVLVKRVSVIDPAAKDTNSSQSKGFMRVEFKEVLITKISWDDGDIVKESCEFKCKHMVVKYLKQRMDSTLDTGSLSEATWDQALNGLPPGSPAAKGG